MDKKYIDADFLKQKISREWDMQDLYLPVHFFDVVDDLPTADVQEVRHGHWECNYDRGAFYIVYVCSECGRETLVKENFCPYCGARMDGEEE